MVSFSLTVLHAIALSSIAQGLAIPANDESLTSRDEIKFLKLDFDVTRETNVTQILPDSVPHSEVDKRIDSTSLTLQNEVSFYSVNLQIGSNKDTIKADIDTGSSDLWVTDKSASCRPRIGEGADYCKASGTFDSSRSSSVHKLNQNFVIRYVDKTGAEGKYVTDDVTIPNGPTLKGLQFGDVTTTDIRQGSILGVGFPQREAGGSNYPNFPYLLKKQGIISKVGYSLYLNAPRAKTGSILFGAIDHAKYQGNLITVPIVGDGDLAVNLQSLLVDGKNTGIQGEAVLDSGTTFTILTNVAPIFEALKASYNPDAQAYIALCDQPNKVVTYNFANNAKINVPYSALLSPPLEYTNHQISPYCQVLAEQGGLNLLGDSFLTSAYVVYDLEKKAISLAQVKYTTDSKLGSI